MPRTPRTSHTTAESVLVNGVLVQPPADEAGLQHLVRSIADMYGWTLGYHTHNSRRSDAGWPDLVLGHPGQRRTVFAELKSATGRVRPEQDLWLSHLAICGFEAALWRPADFSTVVRVLGPARERATCPDSLTNGTRP